MLVLTILQTILQTKMKLISTSQQFSFPQAIRKKIVLQVKSANLNKSKETTGVFFLAYRKKAYFSQSLYYYLSPVTCCNTSGMDDALLNFLENHTVIDTWTVHDLNAHYTWLTGKTMLLLGVRNEKMISKLTINYFFHFFHRCETVVRRLQYM